MSYELQVYALSPLRPSPQDITAKAGESGLAVEWAAAPGTAPRPTDTQWSKLLLRAGDAERGGFLVEASPDLARMTAQFRQDAEAGDEIPDQVFESKCLYVLELDDESPEGEAHQAAFVIAAWALAGLTDGIVFDPQEEFFADADSFWAIVTDETLGEDGEPEGDDPAEDDHLEHAGGCCSGPSSIDIDLPAGTGLRSGVGAPAGEVANNRDAQRRNRE